MNQGQIDVSNTFDYSSFFFTKFGEISESYFGKTVHVSTAILYYFVDPVFHTIKRDKIIIGHKTILCLVYLHMVFCLSYLVFASLTKMIDDLTEDMRKEWDSLYIGTDVKRTVGMKVDDEDESACPSGSPVHPLMYPHPLAGKQVCFLLIPLQISLFTTPFPFRCHY